MEELRFYCFPRPSAAAPERSPALLLTPGPGPCRTDITCDFHYRSGGRARVRLQIRLSQTLAPPPVTKHQRKMRLKMIALGFFAYKYIIQALNHDRLL